MAKIKRRVTFFTSTLVLIGCTTSPKQFVESQNDLSNLDVCRNFLADQEKFNGFASKDLTPNERAYFFALSNQMSKRQLNVLSCETLVSQANTENWKTALIILGAAAAASAAYYEGQADAYRDADQYDYSPYRPIETTSYGYAWDAFYNEHYQLVWACRDKSNGQFAYEYNCYGQSKVDTTWPSK
ncbi:hypothetical protein [Pseudidiomarina terrestris]|uniref:hypothetical protein n=1 Tax=Pseudidiomarina terrestris TaxID=2820060 RepID=UPI00264B8D98|nr:hypothetical protein [Pseudidiomarina sp. 1ASP75-5]MDN7136386.1 hypothetical protein [Pseudidiomarina sp. 1ASP75-5]